MERPNPELFRGIQRNFVWAGFKNLYPEPLNAVFPQSTCKWVFPAPAKRISKMCVNARTKALHCPADVHFPTYFVGKRINDHRVNTPD